LLIGDVFDRLADIPDGSVDLVLTSPPFLALRSYLPAGHPDKHLEIGSEPSPAVFIDTLLALTAEWDRVLAPHGSIAVELGDTYSGGGGVVGSREHRSERAGTGADGGERVVPVKSGSAWPDAKSACLIPELYRVALAYGINPLSGESSPAGRWRVRNTVRWVRPNPPVGALGDKYRPATSDMVVACKSKTRWFDLDAVRTINQPDRMDEPAGGRPHMDSDDNNSAGTRGGANHPAGAPPLDWWNIPTQPYKGSHYATFPIELCRIPILSMCPGEVCTECGDPRRRIVEVDAVTAAANAAKRGADGGDGRRRGGEWYQKAHFETRNATTTGWSVCGCESPSYRPGTVLDPFAGSGTTLAAAVGHGRNAIGIDLDSRNADLCRERVGMFIEVDGGGGA
jgi:DNA modification methylase